MDCESVRRTPRYSLAIHIEMIDTPAEIEFGARTTDLMEFLYQGV